MSLLNTFFLQGGFSENETQEIVQSFSLKEIKKGEYFVEEGKTSKQMGFIEKGFFQYYVNIDGEEKTTYSLGANNLIASLVSFLKQVPSRENIRAVTDSTLFVIWKDDLKKLQQSIPSFNDFYIGLLEWQICCIDESRLDSIVLRAQERYQKMLDKQPELIRDIPLQYLASILGVTPRHLSRIRNSIRN